MAKRAYQWVWNARIEKESLIDLRNLAYGLGFIVDTPGKYQGTGSAPDLLDALAEAYHTDPGGTKLALKVLLQANDLLPERIVVNENE
jgi:hypothetical protein